MAWKNLSPFVISFLVGTTFFLLTTVANDYNPIKNLLHQRHRDNITILSYGFIQDLPANGDFATRYHHVSPHNFQQQINYLKNNQYHLISFEEYQKIINAYATPPKRSVLIIFRDGYQQIYTNALSIIDQQSTPVTLFWDKQNLGQPGYLNQRQLEILQIKGITVLPGRARLQLAHSEQEVSGVVPLSQFSNYLPALYIQNSWHLGLLAILIGAVTLMSSVNRLLALALVPLLLPAYQIRFHILGIPSTLLEVIIFIVFAHALIVFLQKKKIVFLLSWLASIKHSGSQIAIVSLLLATALSVAISPQKTEAAGWAKAFVFDPLLFYFALLLTIKPKQSTPQIGKLLTAYVAAATAVATYSLWRFGQGDGYIDYNLILSPSFFGNPNYLASYLQYNLVFTIGLIFLLFTSKRFPTFNISHWQGLKLLSRFLLYLALLASAGITIVTLSLSSSLGAFGATIAAFIVFFATISNLSWRVIRITAVAILLSLSVIIAIQPQQISDFIGQRSSLVNRIGIYHTALSLIGHNPLFGTGLANFTSSYQKQVPEWVPEQQPLLSHNTYVDFWLQLGLLGFVSLIWLLVVFWRQITQAKRSILTATLSAAMAGFMVHSMVDTLYFKNDYAVIFWMMLAIAHKLPKQNHK